ncbi:zinc finger protein 628 [Phlebotomus argentipes]|uniref:zinc finger protein 628 n=1 Tax=Phlebotomus argentipes TaxID=94469 RepID=UPI002892BD25|nr:zinc finger protein 628 [Phlebotomus argentipes]
MASQNRPSQKHPSEHKPANLVCGFCGLMVDTAASLRVHIHFNHESAGRWNSAPSPTSTMRITSPSEGASVSPTDSENNNQPFKRKTPSGAPADDKAGHQQNPVAAPADSSDNKPPSPLHQICSTTAFEDARYGQQPGYYGHPFLAPPYEPGYGLLNNYDGMQMMGQQPRQQHEYKPVPSHRYHPYQQPINNHTPPSPPHHLASTSAAAAPLSDTIINSTSVRMQMATEGDHQMVSPKQCDKCGFVCDSVNVLNEHCATQHGDGQDTDSMAYPMGGQQAPQHAYIKEETTSDILDLDSQKVVYPQHHHEGVLADNTVLPPMHSLHPLQSMQRHSLMWHEPQSSYMPQQQTLKPQYFPPMKAPYAPPVLSGAKAEYGQSKGEYMSQTILPPPDVKMFADSSNNQVSTSQSDFPTTTTPAESEAFRTQFEPATSSLPSGQQTKSSSWKSNEARRPKTYNCTACNKWFTSSGHLKRHYNTTLHKNAVKSSGQPDPATLPISAHHHPAREAKNNHHMSAPEPPATSAMEAGDGDFGAAQYTGGDFRGGLLGQVTQSNSVYQPQQFCPNPPNGEAGPSALHASQPRGLLNMAITPASHQEVPPLTTIHTIHPSSQLIISSIMEPPPYRPATPTACQLTIPLLRAEPQASYPTIIGDHGEDDREAYHSLAGYEPPAFDIDTPVTRFAHTIGDTVPPFSPDMPPDTVMGRPLTPQMGAVAPPGSPSSPSVTSSARQAKPRRAPRSTKKGQSQEPLKCLECDKVFNKACYLTQHNKTFHSGEKPYKCQRCGKRFPCDQTHEEHVVKHLGEKPFKCDQCPKQFNHKTDLRRHQCLHTGYKPYSCDTCGKGFIRKDHLMKHKEVHRKKAAGVKKQSGGGKNANKKATAAAAAAANAPNNVILGH